MTSIAFFCTAAFLEIAGCFAFWMWLRNGRSPVFAAIGVLSLILFAVALTRVDSVFAGRAFAAYGGVYIAASVIWLSWVEGVRPDRWDLTGAVMSVAGALVILFGRR